MSLRYKRAPGFGVHGGGDGSTGGIWITDETGEEIHVAGMDDGGCYRYPYRVPFWETQPGAQLRYVTAGGGGWGDPFEREPERVLRDVRDGYVTHRGCRARLRCGRDRRPRARSRGHRRRRRGDRAAPERAVTTTVGELLACADELRPRLVELQAETEERTYYSQEIHEAFLEARFYDVLVPKRYGGLELDLGSFWRIGMAVARGCPSTAWCLCLPAGHALQTGMLFEEEAQAELFGDGSSSALRSPRRRGARSVSTAAGS